LPDSPERQREGTEDEDADSVGDPLGAVGLGGEVVLSDRGRALRRTRENKAAGSNLNKVVAMLGT